MSSHIKKRPTLPLPARPRSAAAAARSTRRALAAGAPAPCARAMHLPACAWTRLPACCRSRACVFSPLPTVLSGSAQPADATPVPRAAMSKTQTSSSSGGGSSGVRAASKYPPELSDHYGRRRASAAARTATGQILKPRLLERTGGRRSGGAGLRGGWIGGVGCHRCSAAGCGVSAGAVDCALGRGTRCCCGHTACARSCCGHDGVPVAGCAGACQAADAVL